MLQNIFNTIVFVVFLSVIFAQERALHYVDAPVGDLKIGDGITLVQTDPLPANEQAGRSLKDIKLPQESEARELEVDTLLVDRLARFLGSHTLQFKVPRDAIEDMQRSLEEGRFFGGNS